MFLFIDTSDRDEMRLALVSTEGNFLVNKKVKARYKQSEKLLVNIDKMLREKKLGIRNKKLGSKEINKIDKFRLEGIIVVKGSGSFTALRIGVATANALAFGMGILVVGVKKKSEGEDMRGLVDSGLKLLKKAKKGKWVEPEYGSEPNITTSKKQ